MPTPSSITITERWLMDTAGWAAVKEGKRILGAGAVRETSYEGGLLKGVLKSAGRERVAGMRILRATEVENLCQCSESRRNGGVCGHSAAIALAHLQGSLTSSPPKPIVAAGPKPKAQNAPELQPFAVRLEPNFLELIREKDKMPVRFVSPKNGEGAEWAGKRHFQKWLADAGLKSLPPFLVLSPEDADQFFTALGDHPEIYSGDAEMELIETPARIPLKIEPWGDEGNFSISLRENDAEKWRVISSQSYSLSWIFTFGQNGPILQKARQPELAQLWQELGPVLKASDDEWWIERDAMWLAMHLSFLSDAFAIDSEDVEEIPTLRPGIPKFTLLLEGSLNHVEADIEVAYSDEIRFLYGSDEAKAAASKFPYRSSEGPYDFRHRDLKRERQEYQALENLDFTKARSGRLALKGREAILQFLATGLPKLEQEGATVTYGERFQHVTEGLSFLRPVLRKTQSRNWALSIDGAPDISIEEVRRLVATGRHEISLGSDRIGVVDRAALDELSETLRDVSPEQVSQGVYRIPPEQEPYLYQAAAAWTLEEIAVDTLIPDLSPISGLLDIFRSYQRAGVEWLARNLQREGRGAGGLLADEMGLGKTLQSLAVAKLRRDAAEGPALVVCPTSLIENWRSEAEKFTPDLQVVALHGANRSSKIAEIESSDLVITSYALLTRDFATIYKGRVFDLIILDEAGFIRNPKTKTAKAAFELQGQARVALTGTPVENSLRDLWSIFQFVVPGYLGSYMEFKERYEKPPKTTDVEAAMARLRRRVSPYLLRRTKREVAKDLPDRLEKVVYCTPSTSQVGVYTRLLKQGQASATGGTSGRIEMLTALLRLRQACCDVRLLPEKMANAEARAEAGGKIEALREILTEAIEGGHRVLVFSQFVSMLSLIREDLESQGIAYQYLDGSTVDRAEQVREFQTGDAPVFLISLKAGGYGLNLTAADTVVHFDPWWNPAVEAQATDRAHRIGQQNPVTSYKLIMRDTVEEKILRLQEAKRNVIDSAIDELEPQMTGLSESELQDLLTG